MAVFALGLTHSNVEVTEFALNGWETQVLARQAEIRQLQANKAALQAQAAIAHHQAVVVAVSQYINAPITSLSIRDLFTTNDARSLTVNEYTNSVTSVFQAKHSQEDALAASVQDQVKAINALIAQSQIQGLQTVSAAVQAEQSFDAARAQVAALASAPAAPPAPTATPAPTSAPTTTAPTTTTAPPTTTTSTAPATTTTTAPGTPTKPTTPGSDDPTTTVPASALIPTTPPPTSFSPENPVVLPSASADLQGLSIRGPGVLTAAQIAGWYRSVAHSNITGISPLQLADLYLDEGAAEGVRGDIAFAQAMIETGGFSITSGTDNFAGIGACDSCVRGYSFPSVRLGVRAQIELLKAYADPFFTQETTARPAAYTGIDTLSVRGKEPTWDSLSGVWSSGTSYGQDILAVYQSMVTWALAHPQG